MTFVKSLEHKLEKMLLVATFGMSVVAIIAVPHYINREANVRLASVCYYLEMMIRPPYSFRAYINRNEYLQCYDNNFFGLLPVLIFRNFR